MWSNIYYHETKNPRVPYKNNQTTPDDFTKEHQTTLLAFS